MIWIHSSTERFWIVPRNVCGKGILSPEKTSYISKSVAFHLRVMKRAFESKSLDENLIENIDETHFVIKMSNGRTVGFSEDKHARVTDVVSGGEGMTMMVGITGGPNPVIAPPFMILKNKDRSYPLRTCQDNIPGVSYRTSPKAFIDRYTFVQYLKERRAQVRIGNSEGNLIIYLDNYSGHGDSSTLPAALPSEHAELRFFPAIATNLIQPADSFIIAKIKEYWTT